MSEIINYTVIIENWNIVTEIVKLKIEFLSEIENWNCDHLKQIYDSEQICWLSKQIWCVPEEYGLCS